MASHKGGTKVDMLEYLKLAQDLEMYGIAYYPVINKKGKEVFIGIDCLSTYFYRPGEIIDPKTIIPHSQVHKVKATNKELTIKFMGDFPKPIKVRGKLPNSTKKIEACIDGNMELYRDVSHMTYTERVTLKSGLKKRVQERRVHQTRGG